jgi:hypothetical protein
MTRNLKKIYEDQIDDLSKDADDNYIDFLKEQPETFVYDNLIFDMRHMDKYYMCERCLKSKPEAYCCKGHDLELTMHDIKTVENFSPKVRNAYPRLNRLLKDKNFWEYGDDFEKQMRRKNNDECVFLIPGAKGCYLHSWALENKADPMKIKPYVCSLYPLVVIIIGDNIVITTVNDESEKILDCGSHGTPCVSEKGKKQDHVLFKSGRMIKNMFGAKVYKALFDHTFAE